MSCVSGCVVALDWYLSCTFFRSGVSGAGVLVHALCLFGVRSVWCRCYWVSCAGDGQVGIGVGGQHTKCSSRAFVLMKMGIIMPKTC